MAFREVTLDNKCVTQVLHGDADSAQVSYIAPENVSMYYPHMSGDKLEAEFSSVESKPSTGNTIEKMKEMNKSQKSNQDDFPSDRISRYQGAIFYYEYLLL